MDDLQPDAPPEAATLTIDGQSVELPPTVAPGPGFTSQPEPAAMVGTIRRHAAWLRLQARICVVLIAVLLAGGGVIFLAAQSTALNELDRVSATPGVPGAGGQDIAKQSSGEPDTSDAFEAHLRQDRTTMATSRLDIANRVAMAVKLKQQRLGSFGADTSITSVWFTDPSHGWAAGINGTILLTTDGGASWQPGHSGTLNDLFSVRFVDALRGWAVGDKGTILSTDDGGTTWTQRDSLVPVTLTDAAFADRAHVWVVGGAGTIWAVRTAARRGGAVPAVSIVPSPRSISPVWRMVGQLASTGRS